MRKGSKGITLIALVITIVVLLILAGVTIVTLTGANGLIAKAEEAKIITKEKELEEDVGLLFIEHGINQYKNFNIDLENKLKSIFEKIYGIGNINIDKNGNNYTVKIKESKTIYKIRYDGMIKKYEKIDITSIYGKLTEDGILYLRSTLTNSDEYKLYTNSNSIESNWIKSNTASKASVKQIIIEEPIAPATARGMFANFNNLTEIINIKNLHTENVTNMQDMFSYCESLEEIDLSNFETSKVQNMAWMFDKCSKLKKLDFKWFDTSNVTNMYGIVSICTSLTDVDMSDFDTSKVNNMTSMFQQCSKLKELRTGKCFVINDDINYSFMFFGISNDIRITATEDTINKCKEITNNKLTNENFDVIK